jgi:hypothetical protein
MYSKRKFWAALPGRSETIIKGVSGSRKEGTEDVFTLGLTKRR